MEQQYYLHYKQPVLCMISDKYSSYWIFFYPQLWGDSLPSRSWIMKNPMSYIQINIVIIKWWWWWWWWW